MASYWVSDASDSDTPIYSYKYKIYVQQSLSTIILGALFITTQTINNMHAHLVNEWTNADTDTVGCQLPRRKWSYGHTHNTQESRSQSLKVACLKRLGTRVHYETPWKNKEQLHAEKLPLRSLQLIAKMENTWVSLRIPHGCEHWQQMGNTPEVSWLQPWWQLTGTDIRSLNC